MPRQWTSKTYDFDRTPVPLPPLIDTCSRVAVRSVPWKHVFPEENSEREPGVTDATEKKKDWRTWASGYEPEAGVINFVSFLQSWGTFLPLLTQLSSQYQLHDSLTAHIDQSELDAVRPLVSFRSVAPLSCS